MPVKIMLCRLLLLWIPGTEAMPGTDIPKQTARTVASGDIAAWSIGLLIVLSVFFLCVWGVRKLSGLTVSGAEKMRVVGGLSLGMREKVILLQVGKKQLVLGVTPGRIETLHVLEGDDCLLKEETVPTAAETGFAQKLLQAIKACLEHNRRGSPDA
jgi:flagellar protein FliO/FliZ